MHERIGAQRLCVQNAILLVWKQFLLVGVVRSGSLDLSDEALVEEDLSHVRALSGEVSAEKSAVGSNDAGLGVVGQDMHVDSTSNVMAREDGLELHHAVDVCLLHGATERRVDVGEIIGVAIAWVDNSRVNTSSVAVPDVHEDGWDRVAARGVNELNVEEQRHARLVFGHVAANDLAIDVVWTLGCLWLEEAARVVGEKKPLVRPEGHVQRGLMRDVVVSERSALESLQTALGTNVLSKLSTTSQCSLLLATTSKIAGTGLHGSWFGVLKPLATLQSFFCDRVAGMSESGLDGEETSHQQ